MKNLLTIFLCISLSTAAFAHDETSTLLLGATVVKNVIKGDVAVYNLSNGKLHNHDCEWAEKCTKNCIFISRKQLKNMFYIPCLVCGGGVIEPIEEHE